MHYYLLHLFVFMALNLSRKNYDDQDDGALLSEYLSSGDLEILGALYSRYMELLYGLCLKYFKNRERSQDAVMELFEKLIIELQRHKVDNFRSWLYVMAKNYCLMELRSKKNESLKISIDEHEYLFMENVDEMHPMDRGDYNKDKVLENCIKQLKKEQRECIRLFYYENQCYRDIAQIINSDEKKVKSYLQNAKRNLKICLDGNDEREKREYE